MAMDSKIAAIVGAAAITYVFWQFGNSNDERGASSVYGASASRLPMVEPIPGMPLSPKALNSGATLAKRRERIVATPRALESVDRTSELPYPQRSTERVLQATASASAKATLDAALPNPPRETQVPDLGPLGMWSPSFIGCNSAFSTTTPCELYQPDPRLFITDLNQVAQERMQRQNIENVPLPLHSRQAWVQLLSSDIRSGKDPYTRSSLANTVSGNTTCAEIKSRLPCYVNT